MVKMLQKKYRVTRRDEDEASREAQVESREAQGRLPLLPFE
jgi:hypothetical protein